MLSVPSAFSAALAADGLADGVVLVEIAKPSDAAFAAIRRSLWPGGAGGADVAFDGKTWLGTRGGFSTVGGNLRGARSVWELSLTNVAGPDGTVLPWSSFDARTLRGADVTLQIVLLSQLGDASARIRQEKWKGVRPRLDGEWLRLEIAGPREALAFEVPFHPIVSPVCGWQRMGLYRKHPCDSASDKPTCGGSVSDCAARFPGQAIRFGPNFPYWSKSARRRRA